MFPAGVLLAQAGGSPQLCNSWTYTLVVSQNFPSRMAVVKNVLGNSVSIVTPWNPPVPWPNFNTNWTCSTSCTVTGPARTDVSPGVAGGIWQHQYTWTLTFNNGNLGPDPGLPFNLYNTATSSGPGAQILQVGSAWPFRDFSNTLASAPALVFDGSGNPFVLNNATDAVYEPPFRTVDFDAVDVNWGLEIFSTGIDYVPCSPLQNGCPNAPGNFDTQIGVVAPIDTSDTGNVAAIDAAMNLAANGGLFAYGSTPTLKALTFAETMLQLTATGTAAGNNGSPLTDDFASSQTCLSNCQGAHSFTLPPDPKLDCNRLYATILVTDGLSNVGNPGGCNQMAGFGTWGNWDEPCLACSGNCPAPGSSYYYYGGPGCPDGGDSGFPCPLNFEHFGAGRADDAWGASVIDPATGLSKNLTIRTFVIGISQDVGPCELNYTAYRGRTDFSAPKGDVGYATADDPYLPGGSPGTYDGLVQVTYPCPGSPSHTPTHGNYAAFAGSASELHKELDAIVSAVGIGTYTTSPPSTTSSAEYTDIGLITSLDYPGYLGHVSAWDLSSPLVCHSDGDCPTVSNGAGRCNVATGACRIPDTYRLVWDAGAVLSSFTANGAPKTPNNGLLRKIYTWDPSKLGATGSPSAATNPLVPIEAANIATLNTICGGCGITAQVVDFIRGNDGNGNPRKWALGAVINSTPAVVGPPQQWKQVSGHQTFETQYSSRGTTLWIGASDGAIHGFDVNDGAEVVALIPPDLLAVQVQLYQNYTLDPINNGMGELPEPTSHIYGPANSPRVADIYDPNAAATNGTNYRTILYMTEGPGGQGLHAIDITHPVPARTYHASSGAPTSYAGDPNYGYGISPSPSNPEAQPPVWPLWSVHRTGSAGEATLADLANTWSIPALGGTTNGTNWELVVGSGYLNYSSTDSTTLNPTPHYLRLDALNGLNLGPVRADNAVADFASTPPQPAGGPWVRNQNFADSGIWSTATAYYQPDDDVNQGVQLDLQGHVWLLQRTSLSTSTWASPQAMPDANSVVAGDPLYYAAAIATYPAQSAPTYSLYAFSSGAFYEMSSAIMGQNVGFTGNFTPGLFLASRTNTASPQTVIQKLNISDLVVNGAHLGHRTQVTASPDIYVPNPGTAGQVAVTYLLFDPDANCTGESYAVVIYFNPDSLANGTLVFTPSVVRNGGDGTNYTIQAADAGAGASSGTGQTGTTVLASHSFAGAGGTAYFQVISGLQISGVGGAGASISWWAELQ